MALGPLDRKQAKVVLFKVADLLDSLGIEFCLVCGSALGAHRDKDFCVGDKDIDLAAKHELLVGKIPEILKELPAGVRVKTNVAPFKHDRALHLVWDGVRVDIVDFALQEDKQERFCANGRRNYCIVHPKRMFDNMGEVELFGRKFLVPSPIEEYLSREYGPSWRVPDPAACVSKTRVYGYDYGVLDA